MNASIRGVGALLLGLASFIAVLYVTSIGVRALGRPSPYGAGDMAMTGARWLLAGLVAGCLTSWVAPNSWWRYCGGLGGLLALTLVGLGGAGDLDFFHPAFINTMLVLIVASAIMGGYLRRLLLPGRRLALGNRKP